MFAGVIFGMIFFTYVQAQETPIKEISPSNIPGPSVSLPVQVEGSVNCFDYYEFGSVQVDVEGVVSSTVSGVPITFVGKIQNNNAYPIVEGAVYAKIFKRQESEDDSQANGNLLVDQFFVKENISIDANSSQDINFDWQVPNYAQSGDYQIAMFFTSAKKFNLLGLSFTDDVVGNAADFSVSGEIEVNVEFDKNTIDINGTNYHFAAFPPRFKDEDIQIKAELINFTNESQIIPVTYKLYSWDGQTEENLIETRNETVQIDSQEIKQLAYTIIDKSSPVYYLVVEAQFQDSKSILDIRTVRETANKVRINFPAITNYPLKQGEKNTLFVCAHNSGIADVINNNKMIVSILDENQKEIHQYVYEGQISGAMMGLKDEFVPKENYSNFSIKSELYTEGQLVDSALMKYDCQEINPEACLVVAQQAGSLTQEENATTKELIIMIAVGLTILLIVVMVVYVMFKNKKSGVNLILIFAFIASAIAFGGAPKAEAKSVVWNQYIPKIFYYCWSYGGGITNPASCGGWFYGLAYPNISISYHGWVINADTDTVINDGSVVPVGSRIWLAPSSFRNTDISWVGTGSSFDSPYGVFISKAGPPKETCDDKFYVNDETALLPYGYLFHVYIPLSVNPPKVSFNHSGTAGLSCVSQGVGFLCTVNSPGTIKADINFGNTYGKFYYRYYMHYTSAYTGCYSNNVPLSLSKGAPTYQLSVPSQTVTFNLTAVAANKPPTVPTLTGPITGSTGTVYNFTARATDPDNDRLRYGFDWNNNNVVDQWIPGTGFVNSGVARVATRQWPTTGVKTFKVRACDNKGGCSGFTSHTITIISPPPAALPCNLPWGGSIASGSSVVAYQNSSVLCNLTCQGETRICTNGILSGTYEEQSCSVDACIDCVSPWGTTVVDGGVVIAYENPSVPCGSNCNSQNRLCVGGTLLGSYQNKECVVEICSSNDSNWVEVAP